jgi:hypothetical protein
MLGNLTLFSQLRNELAAGTSDLRTKNILAFEYRYPSAERFSRRRRGAQTQSCTRRTAQVEHLIDALINFLCLDIWR